MPVSHPEGDPAKIASMSDTNDTPSNNSKTRPFPWTDRYLMGYKPMDATHREFVEVVDALLSAKDAEIEDCLLGHPAVALAAVVLLVVEVESVMAPVIAVAVICAIANEALLELPV